MFFIWFKIFHTDRGWDVSVDNSRNFLCWLSCNTIIFCASTNMNPFYGGNKLMFYCCFIRWPIKIMNWESGCNHYVKRYLKHKTKNSFMLCLCQRDWSISFIISIVPWIVCMSLPTYLPVSPAPVNCLWLYFGSNITLFGDIR